MLDAVFVTQPTALHYVHIIAVFKSLVKSNGSLLLG